MKIIRYVLSTAVLFIATQLHAQTWTPLNTGTTALIISVSFPANDTGYILTDVGSIRKTVDGGNSWTSVTAPGPFGGPFKFTSVQNGFIAVDSTLYRTTNGGSTWAPVIVGNNGFFSNIAFATPLIGYVGFVKFSNDSIKYYKTINGGLNWNLMATIECYTMSTPMFFLTATDGFAGHDGQLFSTSNSANTWTSNYTNPNSDDISNLYFPNTDTGYAVFFVDGLARTTNGGASWSLLTTNGSAVFYATFFKDGKDGFVCGGNGLNSGYIIHTTDAGTSWTVSHSSPYTFLCMDFPSDNVGYVGGTNGKVMKYTDVINGIAGTQQESEITIFPNPATEYVEITKIEPGSKISLINLSGQIVKQEVSLNNSLKLNLNALQSGIYFLEVANENQIRTHKLVIQ
jgi:photosystem II stability/assembly factor-like uncharacterized protein